MDAERAFQHTADPFELSNVTGVAANATLKSKLANKLHNLQDE